MIWSHPDVKEFWRELRGIVWLQGSWWPDLKGWLAAFSWHSFPGTNWGCQGGLSAHERQAAQSRMLHSNMGLGEGRKLSSFIGILKSYLLYMDIFMMDGIYQKNHNNIFTMKSLKKVSFLSMPLQAISPDILTHMFTLCWHGEWLDGPVWKPSEIHYCNRISMVDNSKLGSPISIWRAHIVDGERIHMPLSQADRQVKWDCVVKWIYPPS